MMDKKFIGYEFEPFHVEVEKGRLRSFAKAIGQTDPLYLDEDCARKAGYDSLPIPPTFLFTLMMDEADPFAFVELPDIGFLGPNGGLGQNSLLA